MVYVFDYETRESLNFVVIETGERREQVYSPFLIEEGKSFSVECIGYEKKSLISLKDTIKIFLKKNPINMKEVFVFSEMIKNKIKTKKIENNVSKTLEDFFPLLQVRHYNRSKTFTLSGMSQEHILFSIDGVPIINQMSRIVDIDMLSPTMIESAILSKNSNSALLGENLFGGIINLTTVKKKGITSIADFSLNSRVFSVNGYFGSFNGGFFSERYSDMIMTKGNILANSDKIVFGYNLGLKFNGIDFSLLNSFGESGDPGIKGFRYAKSRIKNSLFILTSTLSFNNQLKTVSSVTKSSYFYINDEIQTPAHDSSFFNSILSSISYYNKKANAVLSCQLNSSEGTKIKRSFEIFPSISASAERGRFGINCLAGIAKSTNANFIYSAIGTFDFFFKNLKFNWGLKTSVRRPTFNELYWIKDAFAQGNENLNNEIVYGVFIDSKAEKKNIKIKIQTGFNYYTSLIKWTPVEGLYTPMNLNNVLNPFVVFEINYKYAFLKTENIFSISPNIMPNLKMVPYSPVITDNFRVNLSSGKSFFDIIINYSGDSYISSANTKKINQNIFIKEIRYKYDLSNLSLILSVENPFDMTLESVNGYYLEGRNIKVSIKEVL